MSRVIDEVSIGVKGYLMFKKVMIEGANSISSPITYGFPAITGFVGSFHAMSRKMTEDDALAGVSLGGVLIACYDCQPQVYRQNSYSNYTFNQTRNPIKKDGKTASIIEEGKCRLVVSFVVEVLADDELMPEQQNQLIQKTTQWIQQQRMAGGSVQGLARFDPVQYVDQDDISMLTPQLLPAFVLMDAQDDFVDIINEIKQDNPEATTLDALIDVCALHHIPETQKNGDTKWSTMSRKSGHGWVVPMPIGYQGISDLYDASVMQNVRNPEYASQYVEAIYSLGKWVYPQRLNDISGKNAINNAFWRYHYDADRSLYLVTQDQDLS
ncbi:type I-F CRISPR-associated protein Csy2 [Psychrobacter sp. DM4]|uniref:type I-F CRISPR-associated protein Csy2 n=1 Tax=Psychrobacter sp. DM4 TaxID=3440637 RepID=UPI003F4FB79D